MKDPLPVDENYNAGVKFLYKLPSSNKLSNLLKRTRILFGITQKEMAEDTNLSLKTIRNIEYDCWLVNSNNLSRYLTRLGFNLEEMITQQFELFFIDNKEWLKKKRVVTTTNKGKKYNKSIE